ncbi:hypothetical protein SETIT_3G213100v2 [Setaria italica]|uniref:Uncharacterized protein n=2 Tax=Setaria TaxID=4554 RepID=K3ZB92_SETIT|nr:uncharacterized protein LOC101767691 [Setaria italica]RCV17347.1 hypothetical protein SETIT_3G213100v2 [Setaria italica]TKW26841.1 hypothetical protein SEVIR_3G217940v2 [Setaria viridis]
MATEIIQAPAPAMPAVAGRTAAAAGGAGGNGRAGLPPPRRGQIMVKILKDVVAALTAIAAGLVKNTRGGAGGAVVGGLPTSDDADEK